MTGAHDRGAAAPSNNACAAYARCARSGVHGALLNYLRRCARLGLVGLRVTMAPRRHPLNVM